MSDVQVDEAPLADVEAKARAAPQGAGEVFPFADALAVYFGEHQAAVTGDRRVDRHAAAHMARMDPPTALAFVAEVRRLRAALDLAERERDELQDRLNEWIEAEGGRCDCD